MLNVIAITLATIMIPAAPSNTILPENYSYIVEPTAYDRPSTIKTPNGSDVDVFYQDEGDLSDMDNNDALLADYFASKDVNNYISLKMRGSYKYNNLAYAFYLYWGGSNECIIIDINPYLEDKSYIKVANPQTDDIVCYYAGDNLIHAGIIKNVFGKPENDDMGSNLIVESKWYPNGVFEHRGDSCPYVAKYQMIEGQPADNLIYYRRHTTHKFSIVPGSCNGNVHSVYCKECDTTKEANHDYSYSKKSAALHTATCACGKKVIEMHSWRPYNNPAYPSYNTYVECQFCHFVKQLEDGEIVPIQPYLIKKFKDLE